MSIPRIEEALNKYNIRSNIDSLKPAKPLLAQSLADKFYGADLHDAGLINKHGLGIRCHIPLTTTAICYNGNMPFCAFKYNEQYRTNYFGISSLNDFTQSQEYREFTGYFIDGKLPEICKDCSFCIPYEYQAIKSSFKNFSGGIN